MLRGIKPVARAEVVYSYIAQNKDELSIKPGEVINVYKIDLPDEGWWLGELNGKVGVFPDNFVKVVPESEDRDVKSSRNSVEVQESNKAPPRPVDPPQSKIVGVNKLKGQTPGIRPKEPPKLGGDDFPAQLDCFQTGNKLTHITANRVKGPTRRLPTRRPDAPDCPPINLSSKGLASNFQELDSCWGSGQTGISPEVQLDRCISAPSSSVCLPEKLHEATNRSSPMKPYVKDKIHHSRPPSEREGPIDLSRYNEGVQQPGALSLKEYNSMLDELDSLKLDLKEQVQTNERMVQTLRNFLEEEREKVKIMSVEFENIKRSVMSRISFL